MNEKQFNYITANMLGPVRPERVECCRLVMMEGLNQTEAETAVFGKYQGCTYRVVRNINLHLERAKKLVELGEV